MIHSFCWYPVHPEILEFGVDTGKDTWCWISFDIRDEYTDRVELRWNLYSLLAPKAVVFSYVYRGVGGS
jgi:hypothetical protein